MKYDSGMTYYHTVILLALQHMLRNNSEITEKFSPNDGSPAPLRDYLKHEYGKPHTGFYSGNIHYNCNPTKGLELLFDNAQNNLGDKNLTLSWSQVAKFIRDNWDEVFKKDKPKTDPIELSDEKQPSYLDKLREKYPKISIEDKWVWDDYCPADIFEGEKVPDSCTDLCGKFKSDDSQSRCEKCWNSPCAADVTLDNDELEMFEDDYFEQYPAEDTAEAAEAVTEISEDTAEADKPTENQIATTTENAVQELFDYSELDSDTAKNLRECETVIRQETAGYFTLLGAKFKEAQALLANHASGTFEKWYTAMGFKRQTVYNLIQRYDFLGSPTIGGREDTFEALPLTLSYEVSKPDAPAELVEKVLDGDITTNAEYLKLKAELDRTREECRQLDANSAAKDKEYERQLEEANERAEKAEKRADSSHRDFLEQSNFASKLASEKFKLEEQIKELENRPVDVAVQDNSELMEELEQLREENKRLKDDNVKSFLIRLTTDEYEELLKAINSKPLLLDAVRHAKIIKL